MSLKLSFGMNFSPNEETLVPLSSSKEIMIRKIDSFYS